MEGVRPATAADLERCTALTAEAFAEAMGSRGGPQVLRGATEPGAAVASWHQDPASALYVGTFAEAIVGVGAARIPSEGAPGRIDLCFVEPPARGVGVGSALLEALSAWFAARGCVEIDAVALPGDRDTKQLYENAGFKTRLLVVHRRLD
jgi:GNAT superfamily N-acetyltransferase